MKGENSVKMFGPDLGELERLSKSLKTEIAKVPGVIDPAAFNLLGQPNLDRADRSRQGGALRLLGRRHQHGRAGGDRRPGGDARL